MLNYVRSQMPYISKGIKRHHRRKPKEAQKSFRYANSTDEIQARLIPIFDIVKRTQTGKPIEPGPKKDIAYKILDVIDSDTSNHNQAISDIVNLLFELHEVSHPNVLSWILEKNKKRISKRFYEFAEELLNETNT